MYKSFRYWAVLILGLSYISFVNDFHHWWYAQESLPERLHYVKANFQKGIVLPFFALEDDYPYRTSIDEIADTAAGRVSFLVNSYQEDIRANRMYLNLRAA